MFDETSCVANETIYKGDQYQVFQQQKSTLHVMIYDDDQNITNDGFDLKQSFSRTLWNAHSATSAIDRLFQIKSITFIINLLHGCHGDLLFHLAAHSRAFTSHLQKRNNQDFLETTKVGID